jgi:phenylpyruvate tautomerase PptA (4-oxalocrotonate tautomerase family)
MPLVKIEIAKGRSKMHKHLLLEIVHRSLMTALKIPDRDRNQRLSEYDRELFEIPEGKTKLFTIVEITLFTGRSMDAKRELYRLIAGGFKKELGIGDNDLMIVLYEVPLENWGIRGGKPANEVDLGFEVKV